MKQSFCLLLISAIITSAHSQENAQLQVSPSLLECYQNGTYLYRDNLLPMTLDVLISLIEKVENSRNYSNDIRQVSVQLLHRFRQDGIEQSLTAKASPSVIPYSPIGFQFSKFRTLLSRLIPGNALNFPNNTLTRQERCTLHFMLSSSFNTRNRGDEGQTCGRISQYRSNRLPRSLRNNFRGDVEILHNFDIKKNYGNQHSDQYFPQESFKEFNGHKYWKSSADYGYNINNAFGITNQISSCPVENGIVRSSHGTISPGIVISGIAAGLEYQNINLQQLLKLSRRGRIGNFQESSNYFIDNRFAATLSGDLAEVALIQVPTSQNGVVLGANGGWNNTAYPEWYFLQQNSDLEMTDAEIRGGLDGLILAMNIQNWKSQTSNLRLSQILRMYYSNKGVFGTNIMACNRKQLFTAYTSPQTLKDQTAAFAQLLDREMQLQVTLLPDAIVNFSIQATNALANYIPNNLNDISCSAATDQGNSGTNSNNNGTLIGTDLVIFYDPNNNYNDVAPAINFIVDNLNIGDFSGGSTVTMISALDGTLIVNRTSFVAEFYGNFTPSKFNYAYGFSGGGLNLASVFNSALSFSNSLLNSEKFIESVGGKSMTALVISGAEQMNNNMNSFYDNNGSPNYYLQRELQNLYEKAPDLYFIYYGTGNIQRFNNYVLNQQRDLYTLQPPDIQRSVASNANPVLQRISEIPRRIINNQCGAEWYQSNPIQKIGKQFILPGAHSFYRLHPNYFFGASQQRFIKILSAGYRDGAMIVCSSRSEVYPTKQLQHSVNEIACETVSRSAPYQIDLSNACSDASMIHLCSPVYVSVYWDGGYNNFNNNNNNRFNNGYNYKNNYNNGYFVNTENVGSSSNGNEIQVTCTDPLCPMPNMVIFNIEVDNLGCYSDGKRLIPSMAVLLTGFFLSRLS